MPLLENWTTMLRKGFSSRLAEAQQRIIASKTFQQKVASVGLNPQKDFRYATLERVNFSNSDLRGFDFSGSNLMGSIGVNFIIDETTILDGANCINSCFEYESRRRRLFSNRPELAQQLDRLKRDHWTAQCGWATDTFLKKSATDADSAYVFAVEMLNSNIDASVRKTLLMCIDVASRRHAAFSDFYKEFLRNRIFNEHTSNQEKALDLLNYLKRYNINRSDYENFIEICSQFSVTDSLYFIDFIVSLIKHRFFVDYIDDVFGLAAGSSVGRMAYLDRFVDPKDEVLYMSTRIGDRVLDFGGAIPAPTLLLMAVYWHETARKNQKSVIYNQTHSEKLNNDLMSISFLILDKWQSIKIPNVKIRPLFNMNSFQAMIASLKFQRPAFNQINITFPNKRYITIQTDEKFARRIRSIADNITVAYITEII